MTDDAPDDAQESIAVPSPEQPDVSDAHNAAEPEAEVDGVGENPTRRSIRDRLLARTRTSSAPVRWIGGTAAALLLVVGIGAAGFALGHEGGGGHHGDRQAQSERDDRQGSRGDQGRPGERGDSDHSGHSGHSRPSDEATPSGGATASE